MPVHTKTYPHQPAEAVLKQIGLSVILNDFIQSLVLRTEWHHRQEHGRRMQWCVQEIAGVHGLICINHCYQHIIIMLNEVTIFNKIASSCFIIKHGHLSFHCRQWHCHTVGYEVQFIRWYMNGSMTCYKSCLLAHGPWPHFNINS